MILIVILAIVSVFVLGYLFIKAVNAVFDPLINKLDKRKQRILKSDNPYIVAHRMRRGNDALYEEYLNWLDKTGGGLPIDKIKTAEELRFEKELNKNMKQ